MQIAVSCGKRSTGEELWSIVYAADDLSRIERTEGPFSELALRTRLAEIGMSPDEIETRMMRALTRRATAHDHA
jgi:hypothetical protein